jgi:hypothetical protein
MASTCYFELRNASTRATDSLSADLTRHLHTRQYLGKALVLCSRPAIMLSAMRKQWLRLARGAQKQRASTLDADKILKYTHVITHMQHVTFTAKTPLEHPDADIYILHPDTSALMPPQCWSVYIDCKVSLRSAKTILEQLPSDALVIDYTHAKIWAKRGLAPKTALEKRVRSSWQQTQQFLKTYHIDVTTFNNGKIQNVEAIDDALDTLLAMSHKFLATANEFQRALELARPLRLPKKLREEYDAFILLAHRVQALSPSAFSQRFLEAYNEDDTFLLNDNGKKLLAWTGETLPEALARHRSAGRCHLIAALQTIPHGKTTAAYRQSIILGAL